MLFQNELWSQPDSPAFPSRAFFSFLFLKSVRKVLRSVLLRNKRRDEECYHPAPRREGGKIFEHLFSLVRCILNDKSSIYSAPILQSRLPSPQGAGPIWNERCCGSAITRFCRRAVGMADRVEATSARSQERKCLAPRGGVRGWSWGGRHQAWLSPVKNPPFQRVIPVNKLIADSFHFELGIVLIPVLASCHTLSPRSRHPSSSRSFAEYLQMNIKKPGTSFSPC